MLSRVNACMAATTMQKGSSRQPTIGRASCVVIVDVCPVQCKGAASQKSGCCLAPRRRSGARGQGLSGEARMRAPSEADDKQVSPNLDSRSRAADSHGSVFPGSSPRRVLPAKPDTHALVLLPCWR